MVHASSIGCWSALRAINAKAAVEELLQRRFDAREDVSVAVIVPICCKAARQCYHAGKHSQRLHSRLPFASKDYIIVKHFG